MLSGIIIGCGYISERHLTAWSGIHSARIVALIDKDRQRAEQRAKQFQIPATYDDLSDALDAEKPQFVDIVTRPDSHLPLVHLAAGAGCHVLCQKPFAPTLDEGGKMVQIVRAQGVRIMVAEMWRWIRPFREIKKLLDRNVAGTVHTCHLVARGGPMARTPPVNPRQPYFKDMPRLVTFEMGVHYIDVMRYLFDEVESVYAIHRKLNPIIAGEDLAVVILRHRDEIHSILDYNWATARDQTTPHLRIEGDEATLELLADQKTLWVRPIEMPDYEHTYALDPDPIARAFAECLGHFAECLESGHDFESPASDNLKTLSATLACYDAARTGTVVPVP